jgi:peptidoglycan pentaglycine glycine transferase (the first glycine)
MAANLLMWESIKLGKRLGAERYDMFGSLPPTYDSNDPWAGFTRFKEGYGTEFFEFMGTYDLIVNKPLYTIYGVLNTVRNIFLKLKT